MRGYRRNRRDAIRLIFWARASLLMLLCVSAWGFLIAGADRVVSGDVTAGCYDGGDRTKRVNTARPVIFNPTATDSAVAGHAISVGGNTYAAGAEVPYRVATGNPTGILSGPLRGLPTGACSLAMPAGGLTDLWVSGGRLWLLDNGDEGAAQMYQSTAPDWSASTTWPQAYPPLEWGWDLTLTGLPAQRLRAGVMGSVVTGLGWLTLLLMMLTSALLVWREYSGWPAEKSTRA